MVVHTILWEGNDFKAISLEMFLNIKFVQNAMVMILAAIIIKFQINILMSHGIDPY